MAFYRNLTRPVVASLVLAGSSFFLMLGYEFIRSSSNTLFNLAYGIENLPLMTAMMPVVMIAVVALYGWLLNHFSPQTVLRISILGSGILLALCYVGILLDLRVSHAILYIVREAYAVLIVEQFWSFVNSTLTQQQEKSYNGLILAISTVGGFTGGMLVHRYVGFFGTQHMVIFGALTCLPAFLCADAAYRLSPLKKQPKNEEADQSRSHERSKDFLGLGYFKKYPVLVLILSLITAAQFYSAFSTFYFQNMLFFAFPQAEQQTSYSGLFYGLMNGGSLLIQLIVAPLLLRNLALVNIHRLIPLVHLFAMGIALVFPSLWSASIALFLFKALDYSIFRAAKEILYVPLPFAARFRAKEVIDVFGYRCGKGIASGGIALLEKLAVSNVTSFFPVFGFAIATLWIGLASRLKRVASDPHS